MKIHDGRDGRKEVRFFEIKAGDPFLRNGIPMMKLQFDKDPAFSGPYNAVVINSGRLIQLNSDWLVTLIEAHFHIDTGVGEIRTEM